MPAASPQSAPACEVAPRPNSSHSPRLISFAGENEDLTDSFDEQEFAIYTSQKAPKKKTVARRALFSGRGALKMLVSNCNGINLSWKDCNQTLIQKALSVVYRKAGKKMNCLIAAFHAKLPGIALKIDQRLLILLAAEKNGFCTGGGILTSN